MLSIFLLFGVTRLLVGRGKIELVFLISMETHFLWKGLGVAFLQLHGKGTMVLQNSSNAQMHFKTFLDSWPPHPLQMI